jgi:hypothetical protein
VIRQDLNNKLRFIDRDICNDGWLCTFTIKQQLELPSARSWAAADRAAGTVRQGGRHGPSIAYKITPCCWVTLLQPVRRAAVLDLPSSLRPDRGEQETKPHCPLKKDQLTKKTPNTKCSLYWCLLEFICRLEIQSRMLVFLDRYCELLSI